MKRHLVNGERISDICDDLKINPNLLYKWQSTLFDNGSSLFDLQTPGRAGKRDREVGQLKDKLAEKDGVISELATELIKSKKKIGGL